MATLPRGYETFDLLSDEQKKIYQTILQQLLGQLGGEGEDIFQAPIMRQFQERILPGIAERFAGLGAGAQSSSAFQQSLGSSAADLAERLAMIGQQQRQGALSGLGGLLNVPTQGLVKKSPGLGSILGQAGASTLGGLLGSLIPGLGGSFSSLFGGLSGLGGGGE